MNKVINGVFGGGKTSPKIVPSEVVHHFGSEVTDITALDMLFMSECFENRKLAQQARNKSREIGLYILELCPGPAELVQSQAVKDAFKVLPFEAACTYLLNSRTKDWEKNPGYYASLIVEFLYRERLAHSELKRRRKYAR